MTDQSPTDRTFMTQPPSPTLSRRERERLMRREAILEAARSVFAEKGYTHATIDEVAERAEFGKGTLYNYFEGGKEDLLFAIFDRIFDELHEITEASFTPERLERQPFRDVVHAYIERRLAFFVERQDLFMILIKELHRMVFSDDDAKASYFHRQQDRMVTTLAGVMEYALQAGAIRPMPPKAVAHTLLGNINGLQMHLCLQSRQAGPGCDASAVSQPAEAAQYLTTVIFDGLAPEAA